MKTIPAILSQRDSFVDTFDKLFDKMIQNSFPTLSTDFGVDLISKGSYPKVDIIAYDDKVRFKAEIAGLEKDDISIEVDNGYLTIAGKSKESKTEESGTYLLRELKHSSFKRSFLVSDKLDLDKIAATFNNGTLSIDIPYKQIQNNSTRIVDIK